MMNIGLRPTVSGKELTIEVHIFDLDRELYGETLRIYVKKYQRSEQKFSGLDALKEQLHKDRETALYHLS
jgi:riboflavin kinase/FMN adenylyltransferase